MSELAGKFEKAQLMIDIRILVNKAKLNNEQLIKQFNVHNRYISNLNMGRESRLTVRWLKKFKEKLEAYNEINQIPLTGQLK